MTRIRRSIAIAAALLCASAVSAAAGGLFDPPARSMKDYAYPATAVPAPMPVPETVSWYLRGDIGYVNTTDPDITEDNFYQLSNETIDDNWSIGGGVGYYFSNHIRGDITIDYLHKGSVSATNAANVAADLAPGTRAFDISSWAMLANVYFDFWPRRAFTPYVGAGLGIAYNQTYAGVATRSSDGTTGAIGGADNYDVAVALMAGFTYAFRQGVYLDAGYRFTYLGEAKTGTITTPTGSLSGDTIEALRNHEIRVGLRYDIW